MEARDATAGSSGSSRTWESDTIQLLKLRRETNRGILNNMLPGSAGGHDLRLLMVAPIGPERAALSSLP